MTPSDARAQLLHDLNPAQAEAVSAPPAHRLVLAGAGSGKTRVLTHRIAWLVAIEGVSPQSVLAVTFTNKAAAEMRGRIEQLIRVPVRALWVGTFHGLAHRMLRLHYKDARLPQNFQILDADDQQRLVKRLLKNLDLPDDQWPPRVVTGWINGRKEEGLRAKALADTGDYVQRTYLRIYEAYERQCEQAGLVDFAELLLRAFELCRDVPEIQQHYRRRFRHLLVDEFQDTNQLQYQWLRLLAGDSGILFAVGDDDQCLAAGTPVRLADGRSLPIEAIQVGDTVLSAQGSGRFGSRPVLAVQALGSRGNLVRIRTERGRELVSTPEHVHFAGYRLGEVGQHHFTYLMHKRGIGYRLGTTQVYTRGQRKPMLGYAQRCLHEHADALWVLGVHESENAARAEEMLLSLRYALPTLPFVARRGGSRNGLVHDAAWIARVFAALNTERSAQALLEDLGLSPEEPHHRPQSRDASRRQVRVTLCGDARGSRPFHRISIVGNDAEGRAILQGLGYSVRPAKAGSASWRFETGRCDFGELLDIAERCARALGGEIHRVARLGRQSLPFIRAAALRPGMVMFAEDGTLDRIASVEAHGRRLPVFDLHVAGSHNYSAGGLITHNSVYSWRGARVEHMLKLTREFPGCEIVRLEQNYRSTATILGAANGLIARNQGRLGKELWTDGQDGATVQVYAAFNEYDEAEFVVNRIREHLDGRGRHSDIAILYRTSAQSRVLEEMLIRARLPYRIYGGLRFFERQEVKDALAWLRLLHNRDDDVSFERAVGVPPRGIGATSLDKLRERARAQGISLWQAATEITPADFGRTAKAISDFVAVVDRLGRDSASRALGEITEMVLTETGLRAHYEKDKSEQGEGRLENLDELVNATKTFEPAPDEVLELDPLTAFLTHAALESGETQSGPGEDGVQLMTLHAAKGLEFPVVFMVGMEQGLFPSQRTLDEGMLEEERRLCYVGITRARQQLYLSHAEARRIHGVPQSCFPSQFLKEIPGEFLEETRPRAGYTQPLGGWGGGAGYGRGRPELLRGNGTAITPPPEHGLRIGQRVHHSKFGEGTVLNFDGTGAGARVEVRFRQAGEKWLMLAYAKLNPL
jgi:DNA helicase-2/ATP-dependent DNA helicase PcrA